MRFFILAILIYKSKGDICNGTLTYNPNPCYAPNFTPDCIWLESNSDSICNTTITQSSFVNGNNCYISFDGTNCVYSNTTFDTDNIFCCLPLLNTPVVHTTNSSISSPTPSATCNYRTYNSQNDFSSIQGQNGWYYGYYNDLNNFVEFTNYGLSTTGSAGNYSSWNYNVESNGLISKNIMMPNGANACNTPLYGNISPVLRWQPVSLCYKDVTVFLNISHISVGTYGNTILLTMNGLTVYTRTGTGSINNYYNGFNINSVELTVGPLNGACNYAQTTYQLIVMPMGASNTARPILTNSAIQSISASNIPSKSSSKSATASRSGFISFTSSTSNSISRSPAPSLSQTGSSSATATIFYTGNWVDMGLINYANSDIGMIGSMTISECQLRCWLNPACGLIVVTNPCNTISLNSSEIYTTKCNQCWLKLTSGWAITSDSLSRTLIFYNRVYPPTISSFKSSSSSPSAISSASPVINSYWNFCARSGSTVTLPFIGSTTYLTTNVAGSSYANNIACNFYLYGAGNSQMFKITINSLSTESGYDFLSLYDSDNRFIRRYSGSLAPGTVFFVIEPSIRFVFTSDDSNVGSGIFITVELVYSSSTASPSLSASLSLSSSSSSSSKISFSSIVSPSTSKSSFFSKSPQISLANTWTNKATYSSSASPSNSASISISSSSSISSYLTVSVSGSNTQSIVSSYSSSFSQSISQSPSFYPTVSNINSCSNINTKTSEKTSVQTISIENTVSPIYTKFSSVSSRLSKSADPSPSMFASRTITYTSSQSPSRFSSRTISSTSSASNIKPAGPPPRLPPNLASLSLEALGGLFNSMALYPPALIGPNLQKLGLAALANSPGGEFGITTSAFSVKVKTMPASNESIPLVLGKTSISMPPIIGSSAASVIQWSSNPYDSPVDSMVLSLNVLNSSGIAIEVKNSSKPIIFSINLAISPNDIRFLPTPTYMATCKNGGILVKRGNSYYDATDIVNSTGINTWLVPCLLNDWRTFDCTDSSSVITFTCPPLIYTPKCQYWDSTLSIWSTDGCMPIFSNASLMICSCTHLTDFSGRIDAVAQSNKAIFANAINVYSLDGLLSNIKWYSVFGGIGLLALFLGYVATLIDRKGTVAYVKELLNNKSINPFLTHNADRPIFVYDCNSNYTHALKVKKYENKPNKTQKLDETAKTSNFCNRIFLQHSRLQFIFKYDPRLSRLFRLLFLFTLQFHSLFITALMYNFTYNGTHMEWYDSILLALITTGLNMPVVRLIIISMNTIGLIEFKAQFPLLYEEYQRRLEFEMYALRYIFTKPSDKQNTDDTNSDIEELNTFRFDNDDQGFFDFILTYLCFQRKIRKHEEIAELSHKELMSAMVNIVKEPFPYFEIYANGWQKMPCHTWQGALFIAVCFGWLGWCLNYLLLFASYHSSSVGEKIMISYATSELSTIFLIQPLTILSTFLVYYLVKRFEKQLPSWISGFFIIHKRKTIPSVFYFSDPWNKQSKSPFTSEFAYSIFVECAAKASGTNVLAYAPISAVADVIDGSNTITNSHVLILYKRILQVWTDIKLKKSIDIPSA